MFTNAARIKQAKAAGESWACDAANVRRIQGEQKIVRKVLKRVIASGYSVIVFNGEETHPITCKQSEAWSQLGETDEDRISVCGGGNWIGSILFIWGNGDEIVSDWSWNTLYESSEVIMDRLARIE